MSVEFPARCSCPEEKEVLASPVPWEWGDRERETVYNPMACFSMSLHASHLRHPCPHIHRSTPAQTHAGVLASQTTKFIPSLWISRSCTDSPRPRTRISSPTHPQPRHSASNACLVSPLVSFFHSCLPTFLQAPSASHDLAVQWASTLASVRFLQET